MHVHADIDIMHKVAPARDFEFFTAFVTVHTPKHDLAFAKWLWLLLPFAGETPNACSRLKTVNHHFGNMEFRRLCEGISGSSSDQAIKI